MKDQNKGIPIYYKAHMNINCLYFKLYKRDGGFGRCFSEEVKKNMDGSSMILDCKDCEFAVYRKAK